MHKLHFPAVNWALDQALSPVSSFSVDLTEVLSFDANFDFGKRNAHMIQVVHKSFQLLQSKNQEQEFKNSWLLLSDQSVQTKI